MKMYSDINFYHIKLMISTIVINYRNAMIQPHKVIIRDDNGYSWIKFFDIHTLFITNQVRDVDIHKLFIRF